MLKQNINKIHFDLSSEFGEVIVLEKSNKELGNYVEMIITEGNKEVKLTLKKTEIEKNTFNWSYLSNPINESSDSVYRTSTVLEFSRDIKDIFEKNRFDSDYLDLVTEGYYDDINGYISTSNNNSSFKDGDCVEDENGTQGEVYDILVSPDRKNYVVVVRFKNSNGNTSLGKFGTEEKFNSISQIKKC